MRSNIQRGRRKWRASRKQTYQGGNIRSNKDWAGSNIIQVNRINSRIMEMGITTGRNIQSISLLNTYAPDANQPYGEKEKYWYTIKNHIRKYLQNI